MTGLFPTRAEGYGAARLRPRDYLPGFVLFLFAFLIRAPLYTDAMFLSDSADYLRAARSGFLTEYFDLDSMGMPGFAVRYAKDPEFRKRPWAHLIRDDDHASLRHFHVPMGFYPHALVVSFGGGDFAQRIVAGLLGALLIGAVFLWLRCGGVHPLIATSAALTLALLPHLAQTAIIVSGHTAYMIAAASYLFALGFALNRESVAWWTASLAFLAAAFASLELAFMLLPPAVLLLGISGEARRRLWRLVRARAWWYAPVCFLVTLLILWPPGVYKGNYLLTYGTAVYQILRRADMYFPPASVGTVLTRMTMDVPVLVPVYAVFLAVALILVVRNRNRRFEFILFLIYTSITLWQGSRNKFANATYASQFLLPMWILIALTMDEVYRSVRTEQKRAGVLALAGLLAGMTAILHFSKMVQSGDQGEETARRLAEAAAVLRREYPKGTEFLVADYHEPLNLYLPEFRFEIADKGAELTPRFGARARYYVLVDRTVSQPEQFEGQVKRYGLRPLIASRPDAFWIAADAAPAQPAPGTPARSVTP